MTEYDATGAIVKGKLRISNRRAFDLALQAFKDGPVSLRVERLLATRGIQANRYYWGVVIKIIVDETGNEPMDVHDDMCARFLTKRIFYANPLTGEMDEREIGGRSSKLNVNEFYEFVEKVRLWAAEFLSLTIPDPDPEHWRKVA